LSIKETGSETTLRRVKNAEYDNTFFQ